MRGYYEQTCRFAMRQLREERLLLSFTCIQSCDIFYDTLIEKESSENLAFGQAAEIEGGEHN